MTKKYRFDSQVDFAFPEILIAIGILLMVVGIVVSKPITPNQTQSISVVKDVLAKVFVAENVYCEAKGYYSSSDSSIIAIIPINSSWEFSIKVDTSDGFIAYAKNIQQKIIISIDEDSTVFTAYY